MGTGNLPRSVSTGIFFGLLGFAGNWFSLELFFNVDFLFGSIFVIFALLRFGPVPGIVAGVLAATCTWFLWNHPWAIVISGSEVLFLAWCGRRPERDLLTADFFFWLTIGAPMVWLFYHVVMAIPLQPTLVIVLKQSLNGIINTLLAILIYLLFNTWRRSEHLASFRQLVFLSFVSLIVLPAMGYLIWNLRHSLEHEKKEIVATVTQLGSSVSEIVRQHLEEQVRTMQTVALFAGNPLRSDPTLQHQVDTIRNAAPALRRLAIFNADSVVIARSPRADEEGRSMIGSKLPGAVYLAELRNKKTPLVTDTFLARIGTPVPLAAAVVPILQDGAMIGYCTGILDETPLRKTFETIIHQRQLHFTLFDRNRRVVVSTRADLPMMSLYTRPDGITSAAGLGVQHWVPRPEKGTSIMQRWRSSFFYLENRIGEDYPWTVVVEQSAAPMMERLAQETIDTLTHTLLLIVLTIGLSHLLSRGFIRTIRALASASNKIPERLRDQERIDWPRSGIRELDLLSRNFQQLEAALGNSFASLQTLNETLEKRVTDRTEALRRSEERFRSLFEQHQAIMLLITPETGSILNANQAAADFYGYSRATLRAMRVEQLRAASTPLPAEAENHYTIVHRVAGGDERIMEVYSTILDLDGQKVLFAILHDITERQRMEEELRHSKIEWERTFDAVPDLICTMDSQGRILRMNRAMADRLHVDMEAVVGQHCFTCVHGSMAPHPSCPLIQTLADLRPHSAEILEEKLGGCFHITTTPVFDADNRCLGSVHVARDISAEKKLQEQLHYLSLHDELTGLSNRRALDRAVEQEWRRATRLPQPFSFLLLDIDHFKRYNDTWGHLQGDDCLKTIAAAMQKAVFRAEDFVARYGGEEFAVILPMTSANDAVQIAERIRQTIEREEIRHPDGRTSRVTISIGVATAVPVKNTPPTLLLQMADKALYAAKSTGRNCVMLHPESSLQDI